MRVLAMRRSGNRQPDTFRIADLERSLDPEPDRTYTPDQLGEMLPECDYRAAPSSTSPTAPPAIDAPGDGIRIADHRSIIEPG